MGDYRFIHETAFAGATALTDLAQPESGDILAFHRRAYQIIKAAIETCDVQQNRKVVRIKFSSN
jgi:hypothetical protein